LLRSLSKIVSLVLLLAVFATSHAALFAEAESNSLNENINLTDTSNNSDSVDDSNEYLTSTQIVDVDCSCNNRPSTEKYFVGKLLNPLYAIRAPPQYHL
jgi:hypothetical protein